MEFANLKGSVATVRCYRYLYWKGYQFVGYHRCFRSTLSVHSLILGHLLLLLLFVPWHEKLIDIFTSYAAILPCLFIHWRVCFFNHLCRHATHSNNSRKLNALPNGASNTAACAGSSSRLSSQLLRPRTVGSANLKATTSDTHTAAKLEALMHNVAKESNALILPVLMVEKTNKQTIQHGKFSVSADTCTKHKHSHASAHTQKVTTYFGWVETQTTLLSLVATGHVKGATDTVKATEAPHFQAQK